MALEGDGRLRRARLSDGDVLDVDVVGDRPRRRPQHGVASRSWTGRRCPRGGLRRVVPRLRARKGWCSTTSSSPATWRAGPTRSSTVSSSPSSTGSNAVKQAAVAAHNMVRPPSERRAHKALPAFWSNQFGLNIKSVGLPTIADELVVTQGAVPGPALRRRLWRAGAHRRRGCGQRPALARLLPGADRGASTVPAAVRRRRRASRGDRPAGRVPAARASATHSPTAVPPVPVPARRRHRPKRP